MTAKKKKISEMTQKEILEELDKLPDKIESKAADVVGSAIKLSKSFYALSKDEKAMESAMRNKDLRKDILDLASAAGDLEKTLFQVDELIWQQLKELEKKRDSKKKE